MSNPEMFEAVMRALGQARVGEKQTEQELLKRAGIQ
jgi:hypothetical protein